jgi:hypothetical protein
MNVSGRRVAFWMCGPEVENAGLIFAGLAFHCRPQNPIDAGLIAPAIRSEPFENVSI